MIQYHFPPQNNICGHINPRKTYQIMEAAIAGFEPQIHCTVRDHAKPQPTWPQLNVGKGMPLLGYLTVFS